MNIAVQTKVKTRIIDAKTNRVLKESPWRKNLIMDNGLAALAKGTNATIPASFTTACRIGSGTNPTRVDSGAITFTQSGTTLTASGGFFTASMAGTLFKWGTGSGGVEVYIVSYTDTTHVEVATSATVAVPSVGTVWFVNQSALQTLLYSTANYQTSGSSCGTTFSGADVSFKRTFNFSPQAGSYTVNEIGYFSTTSGSTVYGRIVLPSSDVVAPTNYYQVVLTVTFTFSPGTPTAVGNVGTNIDTSGNAMVECLNNSSVVMAQVFSNGAADSPRLLDSQGSGFFNLATSTYTQNATPGALKTVATRVFVNTGNWTNDGTVLGKMKMSFNTTISTSGQTLYGFGLTGWNNNDLAFDIKLTSTFALPSGSFLPQAVFSVTYGRTLTN